MNKTLIIISCSNKKKRITGKIKAWDLYDGVIFRVLKKNEIDFSKFDVGIISAKYGLIYPDDKIEYYDQMMTKKRAEELQSEVLLKLNKFLKNHYEKIHICLGKNYLLCIYPIIYRLSSVNIIEGGIGTKMKRVKEIITS